MPPPPTIFVPITQTPDTITAFFNKTFLTSFVVRASRQIDLSDQIRRAIQSVDPDLPLASFLPFSQIIDRSLANQRFVALLTIAFGAFALLLAAVGIQGLLNFQSSLRAREIAIRIAVGASRTHIVRMVVRQAAKLISLALLLGLAGSLVVPRLLGSVLYNVQSTSLALIFSICAVLGLIAALISLLTAIRAASIDPVAVLRNE
jgi:ABC-type antimicrobial peptide transport system permease subunit